MVAFCQEHGIPHDVCGKVIVATSEEERPRLADIFQRGQENGVACEVIGPERLRELEPHVTGVEAIHVPDAGIVDYPGVAEKLVELVAAAGGTIVLGRWVIDLKSSAQGVVVESTGDPIESRLVVTCGGLYSDRLASLSEGTQPPRIVPFRGEYYELRPEAKHLCKNLIYPVPDPAFPFLGVHLTRMIGGAVECGPNAVLALSREGYTKAAVNLRDVLDSLGSAGFQRLAARHWRAGLHEIYRSFSQKAFAAAVRRLVPEIEGKHLIPAPAGVRAQALDEEGRLLDDFAFEETERVIHVCNAPSPAATASLSIGGTIADKVFERGVVSAS